MAQILEIGQVRLWMVEGVLSTVVDGVESAGRLENHGPVSAMEFLVDWKFVSIAKVFDGVGQSGRAETDVFVRLESEHHVLHEEFEERMSGVECHNAVLDPIGQKIDKSDRVSETVKRAENEAVQVEIEASSLPQDGDAHGVAPMRQRVSGLV